MLDSSLHGVQTSLSQQRLLRLTRLVVAAAHARGTIEISVAFVGKKESQKLNRQYRKKNRPTNVLSFPLIHTKRAGTTWVSGEIVLCPPIIRQEAQTAKVPMTKMMDRLYVHGVLHLLGYDHVRERDFRAMQHLEVNVLGSWIL